MEEVIAKLLAMHRAEAWKHPMVYEVWHDGEVTLTKGGDLYRQRSLHMIVAGNAKRALPADSLIQLGKYSRIMVDTAEEANEAATLILGPCPYHTKWV